MYGSGLLHLPLSLFSLPQPSAPSFAISNKIPNFIFSLSIYHQSIFRKTIFITKLCQLSNA